MFGGIETKGFIEIADELKRCCELEHNYAGPEYYGDEKMWSEFFTRLDERRRVLSWIVEADVHDKFFDMQTRLESPEEVLTKYDKNKESLGPDNQLAAHAKEHLRRNAERAEREGVQ